MTKPPLEAGPNSPAPRRWVLIAIILVCCGIEFILMAADHGVLPYKHLRGLAYQNGGFWTGLLHDWKPNFTAQPATMFFTYSFLHAGFLHLTMNMMTLWSLGVGIIERVGPLKFTAVYLASLLGGAVAFGALSSALAPMVGASGALFGLVGAWLVWEARERYQDGVSLTPILRPIVLLILLNFILWWATSGRLAWETHLGGAVFGALAGIFIRPKSTEPSAPNER
ncbi:rhomboid family intramembrane serine protease [Roseobacter sp. N2S]|uniref:rhomboid family intramembrane serine protease n=1 Tax=Roseobacter sp. N2S TaxID=2663844 RepID=UPI0028546562|nr:rhomboid family intramembrane serine protease [Roseobacter sp. N2S]MDR6267679.1 membrane associated rhomboid family serine protease [Roseobacter sp. N2S]